MATPDTEPGQTPPAEQPVVTFLKRYLEMAQKGEIQSVVLGYVRTDGGAAVQSTPMSTIMMNHLSTLLELRVAREYARAMAQASAPAATTGARGVPEKGRTEAQLPRKARRAVEQRRRNLQKLAMKEAKKKQAAAAVVGRVIPVAAPPNGTGK